MPWLGLDIGGANLKLADGAGYADSQPFALWQEPDALVQRLRLLIAQAPAADHLAVTMTGELADCFETKAEGVAFILDAVQQAADGRHTRVYLSSGRLVTPQVATRRSSEVAAANWHALAAFSARHVSTGAAAHIDIGSTTTDIIPLQDGQVCARGLTDTARLQAGELLYLGVERTPVCAVSESLPYRGALCSVAREHFATVRDAFMILGDLPEDPTCTRTADGRPAVKSAARARLGRMICADGESFNHRDAVAMAQAIVDRCVTAVADGFCRIAGQENPPNRVMISGQGEFLARRALQRVEFAVEAVSFTQIYGHLLSRCAPAHAVAVLAQEDAG